jgi:hypothetical protein
MRKKMVNNFFASGRKMGREKASTIATKGVPIETFYPAPASRFNGR